MRVLETAWRAHRFALVAALATRFRDLDLAEEALADAVVDAQRAWASGAPDDPAAWLYRTAQRRGLDRLRRARTRQREADAMATTLADPPDADASTLPEARLGLIFACAHPALSPEAQAALILFHVGALPADRIARAFLTSEATIHQRLKRARDKLKANAEDFAPPAPAFWPERLGAVLSALEVIYAQSHDDCAGETEVEALARDALHLSDTLCALLPDEAEAHSLAAVFAFCEGRRPARLDAEGRFVPLDRQDPRRWNAAALSRAAARLQAAAKAAPASRLAPGRWSLQAQIQSAWTLSRLEGRSRAAEIVALYDDLLALSPSPVAAVSRALALAERDGPAAGLAALDAFADAPGLQTFAPCRLARADLLARLGRSAAAAAELQAALPMIRGRAERDHVAARLASLKAG